MSPLIALLVVAAIVAAATLAGLAWRARVGRRRTGSGETVDPGALGPGTVLGREATLLQFSSDYCGACGGTRAALGALAAERPGLAHLEVNLSDDPSLAGRFRILQTPTTLLLDSRGAVRSRFGGPPRMPELRAALAAIPGGPRVRP